MKAGTRIQINISSPKALFVRPLTHVLRSHRLFRHDYWETRALKYAVILWHSTLLKFSQLLESLSLGGQIGWLSLFLWRIVNIRSQKSEMFFSISETENWVFIEMRNNFSASSFLLDLSSFKVLPSSQIFLFAINTISFSSPLLLQ